jgi:hypothetical protein
MRANVRWSSLVYRTTRESKAINKKKVNKIHKNRAEARKGIRMFEQNKGNKNRRKKKGVIHEWLKGASRPATVFPGISDISGLIMYHIN